MQSRLKLLLREPALLIDVVETAIVVAVSLGLFSLSGESQRYLIALVIALLGLVKGFSTKPFPVTVVPDLGRAALVFFGSVNLIHLDADQITLLVTFLGTLMTLLQRAQITPVSDPVATPTGSGAGPVRGETGAYTAGPGLSLGLVLAVIGVLVLLLTPYFYVGIILIVVGLVLALVWRG